MTTELTISRNVDTVQSMYDAFARGDIEFILSQLQPDVTWKGHFDPIVPWGGSRKGIGQVAEFFAAINDNVDVLGFESKDRVSEGDTVVSMGTFSCRGKRTGKETTTEWVFIWKFRDGKVYSYEQFHDNAITDVFRD